jgi:pimeloyl-ACP methyl ester carboxylesterase
MMLSSSKLALRRYASRARSDLARLVAGQSHKVFFSSTPVSLGRSASRLQVIPCSPTAAREAPTPIVFASGLVSTAEEWRRYLPFFTEAPSHGYTVGLLDLPGYGLASSGHDASTATLDELVDDMQATLKKLHTAPIVIAPSVTAVLFQKFLESFPIAGLIAVSPLPPDPRPLLKRHLCIPTESKEIPSQEQIATWLRRTVMMPEKAAEFWLGLDSSESEERDLSAFNEVVETLAGSVGESAQGKLCGLEAASDWLHKLCKEPVNLEPQPIPMLAIYGQRDKLLSQEKEDKMSMVDFHQLELGNAAKGTMLGLDGNDSSNDKAILAAVEDGSIQAVSFASAGHDFLQSNEHDAATAKQLSNVIQRWIEKRY